MASKFGLAGGIPERRVRPIWDAVDSRQFKAALKLSTALLSKYPNSPYALALKALILERMGKSDEALTICLNAKEQLHFNSAIHVDDLTLSTLQIVFQRLDHLELATSCYEHACEKYPNNLELMMGLFNCYVREYSFVKQQQTAIKMYKIVGEERFLLWAACSIQLQVFCSNGGDKLLHLAEALLKKHISAHSLHEPEALLMYVSLLEQQEKYSAALEVLSGNLGSLVAIKVDKLRLQGRLLARAGDYAAAADVFQKVMESCPDDWDSFLHYLDCLLEVDICWTDASTTNLFNLSEDLDASKLSHLNEELFNCRISTASTFIQKLQLEHENDSIRCPHLANIEIEKRRRMNGKTGDIKFVEALYKYFCRFSHLSCFASDVEDFLHILSHNEKLELLQSFMRSPESSSITPIRRLGHAITIYKLQELLGVIFGLSIEELRGTAVRMVELYIENLILSKNLDPQENIIGEELLSMASNVLVQLFWRTKQFGYLLEAIMVLEFGLTIRRFTWQYKILLLHLYSHLGAYPLASEWFKTMEVKNILLETISHHILPQMLNSPLLLDTSDLLKDYLKFMDDYMREAADHTFLACRHRNYSKVIEFVQFKKRLQHSHQYLIAKVEDSLLQVKRNDSLQQVESVLENLDCGIHVLQLSNIEYESLTFNYDIQSRPWWSPTADVNHLLGPFEVNLVSPQESLDKHNTIDKKLFIMKSIERRSLLPRLISLSIQTASSLHKDNAEINGSACYGRSGSELKSLMEQYTRNLGHSFDDAVKIIVDVSEGQKSPKEFGSDMIYWMNFAIFFNALNFCSNHLGLTHVNVSSSWLLVDQLVKKCVTEHLAPAEPLLTCPGSNLSSLAQMILESFSWHLLVLQSCIRSVLPSGKKKKKSGPTDRKLPLSKAIRDSIYSLTTAILDIQGWLQEQLIQPDDKGLDILLCHVRKEHKEGPGQVLHILEQVPSSNTEVGGLISQALQSWTSVDVARKLIGGQHTVFSELVNICERKLKLLKSMKLSI